MYELNERARRIAVVNMGLLAAFILVGLALAYWSVVGASALATREDNPRVVEAELRVRRGRILDARGVVLAETIGPEDSPQRVYSLPNIGPAVGYYSFRHGTSGIEEGYDGVLRGDTADVWQAFWQQNLHRAQRGRDVRLTLDADWQRTADSLMEGHNGAVMLMSVPEGAIRVMVSHPGYDPNMLDAQFDALAEDEQAPLLNRVTQGRYQPGLTLQPLLLAAALDGSLLALTDEVQDAGDVVTVNGLRARCREAPPPQATWADVLHAACPNPMLSLAEEVPEDAFLEALEHMGFFTEPDLPLATAAPAEPVVNQLPAALLGQDALTVTPLQMALAWSSLGNSGILPQPRVVSAVQDEGGSWTNVASEPSEVQAFSGEAAWSVLSTLPRHEERIAEHAALVLSGPGGSTNSWYLGLAPAGAPRYAVIVVIEETARLQAAEQVGRPLLDLVLDTADN
ncbi:MAG TPA: penicillin-binding transpeptidase domain-containing protein [Candidatus Sulfomarinibacteraceae bacterium]|nr:penicillin-binding transpeptidase domain-containing protein [Candidatus Sulfomarinibacteraceae bacterium]